MKHGTAVRAQYGGFAAGKTGTTENSGDAWFVGFTPRWTIAVWVGYPDSLKPMLTEFRGSAVTGGTFPAMIWHDFVVAANKIIDDRNNEERKAKGLPPLEPSTSVPSTTQVAPTTVPREGAAPEGTGTTDGRDGRDRARRRRRPPRRRRPRATGADDARQTPSADHAQAHDDAARSRPPGGGTVRPTGGTDAPAG